MPIYASAAMLFTEMLINIDNKFAQTLRRSRIVSANPMTYMAAATAFAKENMMPIDPPNSGPRLREII